jgi:D-glycero-D-manno-heptose 1,7-bisphosphate phosphatase
MTKLIILDRDGVINHDSDLFIKSPQEWYPIPGSPKAIADLNFAGWKVAVATNQSGIARGLFSERDLNEIHDKMKNTLAMYNATVDFLVWCPHGPSDNCECRKPRPGLYRQIAGHFQTPLENVPVIGDSVRDLEAAIAVGARPILVKTGKGLISMSKRCLPSSTEVYPNLAFAVKTILSTTHEQSP